MSSSQMQHIRPADANRRASHRWWARFVAVIYGLVMFEVIIMVSPFAFYFYAAYGPTLKWMDHFVGTAWLTGFLLPHAVVTNSQLLEILRWDIGRYAFALGLWGFLVLALQIYGSKLLGRETVSSGAYRYIRHPQYLSLGIAAFGLFTAWPRVIIFLLLVGMLVVFYLLARVEERHMLAIDPSYAAYMRRTGMFLPCNPGNWLYRLVFARMTNQRAGKRLALGSVAGLLLLIGFGLRAYTLLHIPHSRELPNLEVVAGYPILEASRRDAARLALQDAEVQKALQREGAATFVAHVLPRNYGMIGMFADVGPRHMTPGDVRLSRLKELGIWLVPFVDANTRSRIMGSENAEYRIVFSRVDDPRGHPVRPDRIFDLSSKMTAVSVADVKMETKQVVQTITPPRRSFWGEIKMPIF
jgi:protein-S-isoprenylcysteine O-methyltransferase Ste14